MTALTLLATLPLWFFADFDGVPLLDGAAYTEPLVDGYSTEGRFGKGHAFVLPDKRGDNRFWRISDPAVLASFPRKRGAFACWFRSPEDCLDKGQSPAFGYCGYWQFQWVWRGGSFNTGTAYGESLGIKGFKRSAEWRHFAAVWNDEKLVVYLDGVKAAEKANPQRMEMDNVPNRVLRIGSGFDGSPPANLVMDEIAIFSRDLTSDEVKRLATATVPLRDHKDEVLMTRVAFPIYWRNQADAALRTRVLTDSDRELIVKAKVNGRDLPEKRRIFKKGWTRLAMPLDVARLQAGKYPWELALVDAAGRRVAGASGEMEIRSRIERKCFKVHNWGGYKALSPAFMHGVGINASNCGWKNGGEIGRLVRNDIFANPHYNDVRRLPKGASAVDVKETMRRTDIEFAPLEGLHLWAETLVNSEVYAARVGNATNDAAYVDFARSQLGFEPDFNYGIIEIDPKTLKGKVPRGVIRHGECPQLDTLCWALRKGHPYFIAARAAARAIHALQPDNIVWSEPMFEGLCSGLDMVADWQYEYSTDFVLRDLLLSYGPCRGYGVKYQPTLSPSYWDPQIFGWHPTELGKDGKPLKLRMCQSADEVAIKAWIALSAVPAHSLGLYEADMWEWGLKGAATNGREHTYAEPDVVERYGKAWHGRLAPVADLFQDMPNAKAPIAVVLLEECLYGGGFGWGQYHYPNQIAVALSTLGVPYDVVYGREVEREGLVGYKYAILPMARLLYEEHVKALEEAAASGVRIVTDQNAFRDFAGGDRLKGFEYPWAPRLFPELHKVLRSYFEPMAPSLKNGLVAWSESNGETNGFTFVKTCGPVRYVSVVNDRRSDNPGYLGQFVTNAWYRPMGAPQRITTHFNLSPGAAVYEFNVAPGRKSEVKVGRDGAATLDYPAADGKVFCIYPRPLKKLRVSHEGDALEVTLLAADGKPAPGRQVVEIEVRDPSGALHDETGRYVMENGRLVVPLRFADEDPPRGIFSAWKASARDLTCGFTDSCSIR